MTGESVPRPEAATGASTKVISFYDYDQAFHYLFFGYGAAISWLITAFMLVLIGIYTWFLRAEVEI